MPLFNTTAFIAAFDGFGFGFDTGTFRNVTGSYPCRKDTKTVRALGVGGLSARTRLVRHGTFTHGGHVFDRRGCKSGGSMLLVLVLVITTIGFIAAFDGFGFGFDTGTFRNVTGSYPCRKDTKTVRALGVGGLSARTRLVRHGTFARNDRHVFDRRGRGLGRGGGGGRGGSFRTMPSILSGRTNGMGPFGALDRSTRGCLFGFPGRVAVAGAGTTTSFQCFGFRLDGQTFGDVSVGGLLIETTVAMGARNQTIVNECFVALVAVVCRECGSVAATVLSLSVVSSGLHCTTKGIGLTFPSGGFGFGLVS